MKRDDNFSVSNDLTHENFYNERKFKEEVLKWLTNGKPKLFRSPSEGNYVIRLLNTSLAPQEQLGRMLHTFSSTGYEMINGKVYYYEEYTLVDEEYPEDGPEFSSEEDEEVYEEKIRYYFNGNDLVYVNSSGFLMEILISSSIPERMFRTECPTGYLDYTGRVEY